MVSSSTILSAIFTDMQLHIPFRLTPLTGPTMHQPNLVWNAHGDDDMQVDHSDVTVSAQK